MRVGFVGLGVMGAPMALNLVTAGTPLLVWNRDPAKTTALATAGARTAPDSATVFAESDVVILMLTDGAAINSVLHRGDKGFTDRVRDRVIVHMGTTAPAYSRDLEADIVAAGGRYVEAPVSGSREPAENAELVALLAGDPDAVALVKPLLKPMCRDMTDCGPVPNGLLMKLSVNIYLITVVSSLAETMNFARANGLDLTKVADVLAAGQMASPIMRVKTPMLVADDLHNVQASIANVWMNADLITSAARAGGVATPLLDVCHDLLTETRDLGLDNGDMIAVVRALE
ncbi:NAD(P)-dependent oxidoreductase, partial [Kibdelosporangium lantanae]